MDAEPQSRFNDLRRPTRPSPGVRLHPGSPNWVVLTVTSFHREPWLATPTAHALLHDSWREADAWLVSHYVLMPDHLHCFAAPQDLETSIEHWITYWKRDFRRRHGRAEWRFQSRGWHHRLRVSENYANKWQYVQENPVRAGLAARAEEWPYQGRVHDIRW